MRSPHTFFRMGDERLDTKLHSSACGYTEGETLTSRTDSRLSFGLSVQPTPALAHSPPRRQWLHVVSSPTVAWATLLRILLEPRGLEGPTPCLPCPRENNPPITPAETIASPRRLLFARSASDSACTILRAKPSGRAGVYIWRRPLHHLSSPFHSSFPACSLDRLTRPGRVG